ncbi:MAG: iron ABC transporter permease [Actinomycetota bacterium]|nr:iron ABC transporter permease [Actinomycetota bacterium]
MAALFAAPLLYLLIRNAGDPGELAAAVSSERALAALRRTVLLAAAVSASAAAVGTLAAWLVVRTDLPGRRVWRVVLPLPLVIPSFIGAFALIAAFAPGGLFGGVADVRGFAGAFLVLTLLTYPYVYLPVAARLGQLPGSLEESARLLGRRGGATFVSIVLPQLRGAILAGGLLVFLYCVSDFGAVQLLRYDTLTRTIYSTRLLDQPTSLALSLELGVLALAVVAAERAFAPGRHVESSRGRPVEVGLGAWRLPALAIVGTTVALALAAPVAVLGYWAWRGLTSGSERASSVATDLSSLVGPALNTAGVSVAAAMIALVAVLPVAYLTVRRRGPLAEGANAVVVGGFALPGLAIALALVFWTLGAPWPIGAAYQTLSLLLFAYVVHFGAQTLRAAQVAVAGIPAELEEAASALGAGRVRRYFRVELPLMAPALGAGAGLVLLSTMKELPATLLLAPPGFHTLATTIWTSTEDAFIADASIASLLLIALSGVLTWLLLFRAGRYEV